MKASTRFVVLALLLLVGLFRVGLVAADTTYIVQSGDTLSAIAVRFGVTVRELQEANSLENVNLIFTGQQLVIPGVDGPIATPSAPVATSPAATAVPPAATPTTGGVIHVVQPGDNLYRLSIRYGTTVAAIRDANQLVNVGFIVVGQELLIPGGTIPTEVADAPAAPQATPIPQPGATAVAPTAVPPPPAAATNLLPNGSFEGDWYFYLYNELQVPDGWQLAVDEGPNTLEPGSGGVFNRPEVRVVSTAALPPSEHPLFIFDGFKTVKVFKGGAPTNVSLFTDVHLQPGTYRLSISFFPDIVAEYQGGTNKVFATDPLAAEARIIHNNGGTGWQTVNIGQKNTLTYDFTVTQAGAVRVGGSFRNRFETANNGWFLDNWVLTQLN